MMSLNHEQSLRNRHTRTATSELRPATRAVAFLALLTGVLYLRALAEHLLGMLQTNNLGPEDWLTPVFLIVGSIGLLLVWRHEALGGLVALLSGLVLAIGDHSAQGRYHWLVAFLYSSPFLVAGLMCLLCWRRRRSTDSGL
ncbi:MAG: hypothetical protein R3300_02750 [Candidatus Promineifilaceae bacterium]|nr:hypothetical protein [Candidatus Promineifilaceae bacterium]